MDSLEDSLISDDQLIINIQTKENDERQLPIKIRETFCQKLIRCLCCQLAISDENEFQQNHQKHKIKTKFNKKFERESQKREKNELVIFGNNTSLMRITLKNFFVNKNSNKQLFNRNNLYLSLNDIGTRMLPNEHSHLIEEKVLKYLTKRILSVKPQIVIDLNCGSSGPFLFKDPFIQVFYIAISQSINQIKCARHNSQIYQTHQQVDFIQGEPIFTLQHIKQYKPDLIYVFPHSITTDEPFSIFTNLQPQIQHLIPALLISTSNIVLVLPGMTSVEDIQNQISFYGRSLNIQINKFEVQKIQVDGYVEYIVVYIGDVARIQAQDEYEYIVRMLVKDSLEDLYQPTYQLIQKIKNQISFYTLMDISLVAQQTAHQKSDTILNIFLIMIIKQGILQQLDLNEIYSSLSMQNWDQTAELHGLHISNELTFDGHRIFHDKNLSINSSPKFHHNRVSSIKKSVQPSIQQQLFLRYNDESQQYTQSINKNQTFGDGNTSSQLKYKGDLFNVQQIECD